VNNPGWEGRSVDRYHLIRRIGRGGMGEVYLAELEPVPGVRKLAAVKLLKDVGLDPGAEGAFAAEARLAALISHPNVVQLVDAGVSDDTPWLAMEYVAGLSLNELLRASATALPPWVGARIIADACAGLHAVHEATNECGEPLKIVHRDVTPHNVLIGWDGIVKVTDFGVARSALQSTVTKTGTVKGKLAYMAPEQASGAQVDRRADVFALGILLFETLTGKKLFKSHNATETLAKVLRCELPPLAEVAPQLSPELRQIIARALERDPAARYASAREMQRALEAALRTAGVVIGPLDVAEVIASLLPARVREHEAWLREHSRDRPERSVSGAHSRQRADLTAAPTSAATIDATLELAPAAPQRWGWRWPLAVALGVLLTFGAALFSWSRLREPSLASPISAATASMHVAELELVPQMDPLPEPPAPSAPAAEPRAQPARPAPVAAREYGTLNVGSAPVWARVFVDGRAVGATPIAGLRLPAGTHLVEARPKGKPAQRRSVKVPANSSASVHFRFE
jgi:eukaryotic-like serine/threonine-protein kinase